MDEERETARSLHEGGEPSKRKARKPYVISKQRERWSDHEHTRFLEALKLYGRAWRRIEEHIGTKTAVQIRSHAQKFFTKVEKYGGPEDEIHIPPPRPKRKPSKPYPRKSAAGGSSAATDPGPLGRARSSGIGSMLGSGLGSGFAPAPARLPELPIFVGGGLGDAGGAPVAAVAAAASAAAAAAAAAVVAAAGEHVQAQLQACPPQGFPFWGLPPSMRANVSGTGGGTGGGNINSIGQDCTGTSEPGGAAALAPAARLHGSDGGSACSREENGRAAAGAAAPEELGRPGDTGATSHSHPEWAAVVAAAAAAASGWEIRSLAGHPGMRPLAGVMERSTGGAAGAAAAPTAADRLAAAAGLPPARRAEKARRPVGGGSGGGGTAAGAKAAAEMGSRSAQLPESASPERTGAQAANAGSNDTDTSAQANGYQCAAARAAYPGDADVLEGEGSGSNPMGNGSSGGGSNGDANGSNGGAGGSGSGNGSGTGKARDNRDDSGAAGAAGADLAPSIGTSKAQPAGDAAAGAGARAAVQGCTCPGSAAGASGGKAGSDEGCTSSGPPGARARNPNSDHMPSDEAAAAAALSALPFAAAAQGTVDAAQMAQATSSLQQAGLASYFLQPAYTAQLAQLQQAAMLPWGAQTPFEMLSSVLSFQAFANQQQVAAQSLAAGPRGDDAAATLSCPVGSALQGDANRSSSAPLARPESLLLKELLHQLRTHFGVATAARACCTVCQAMRCGYPRRAAGGLGAVLGALSTARSDAAPAGCSADGHAADGGGNPLPAGAEDWRARARTCQALAEVLLEVLVLRRLPPLIAVSQRADSEVSADLSPDSQGESRWLGSLAALLTAHSELGFVLGEARAGDVPLISLPAAVELAATVLAALKRSCPRAPAWPARQPPKAPPERDGAAPSPGIAAHALRLALQCLNRHPTAAPPCVEGVEAGAMGAAATRLAQCALALHALSVTEADHAVELVVADAWSASARQSQSTGSPAAACNVTACKRRCEDCAPAPSSKRASLGNMHTPHAASAAPCPSVAPHLTDPSSASRRSNPTNAQRLGDPSGASRLSDPSSASCLSEWAFSSAEARGILVEDAGSGDADSEEALASNPLSTLAGGSEEAREAWWQHYIAVKQELVDFVLQDVPPDDGDSALDPSSDRNPDPRGEPCVADAVWSAPSAAGWGRREGRGGGDAAGARHGAVMAQLLRGTPRQREWRALQAAAAELAAEGVLAAAAAAADAAGPGPGGAQAAVEAALQAVAKHVGPKQQQRAAYAACYAVNPLSGQATLRMALQGAEAAPVGAAALWAAACLHRSVGGAAMAAGVPEAALTAAYLRLIDVLARVSALEQPKKKGAPPLRLLSEALQARDGGHVALCAALEGLLGCVLRPLPVGVAAAHAAAALAGISQAVAGDDHADLEEPAWVSRKAVACSGGACDWFLGVADAAMLACAALSRTLQARTSAGGSAHAPGVEQAAAALLAVLPMLEERCRGATRDLISLLACPDADVADSELTALCESAACGLSLEPQLAALCPLLEDACVRLPQAQVARLAEEAAMAGSGNVLLLEQLQELLEAAHEAGDAGAAGAEPLHERVAAAMAEALQQLSCDARGTCSSSEEEGGAGDKEACSEGEGQDSARAPEAPRAVLPGSLPGKRRGSSARSGNPFVRAALAEMARRQGTRRRASYPDPNPAFDPRDGEPELDAAVASSDGEEEDSFSDLDDFIVCQPGRDYGQLFSAEFAYSGRKMTVYPRSKRL
ncbi:hypothetical protein WJX81_001358 [Elliptochloris bilobata]|uniref:Uncharacterized protein n=1 Tax=Elliptochloris bilobata TaxID=381761 RepID=A0AAW1RCN5_9CHLO